MFLQDIKIFNVLVEFEWTKLNWLVNGSRISQNLDNSENLQMFNLKLQNIHFTSCVIKMVPGCMAFQGHLWAMQMRMLTDSPEIHPWSSREVAAGSFCKAARSEAAAQLWWTSHFQIWLILPLLKQADNLDGNFECEHSARQLGEHKVCMFLLTCNSNRATFLAQRLLFSSSGIVATGKGVMGSNSNRVSSD